jgi:LPS-assembly protein
LADRQPLEVLSGFEYNESCWTMRFVTQQFTTAAKQVTTGFFVQLELNGMVRMGSDPFTALRQSISGFTKSIPSSGAPLEQGLR